MKCFLQSVFVLLLFVLLSRCNNKQDSAVFYNDSIVQIHEQIVDQIYQLTVAFYRSSPQEVLHMFESVQGNIDTSIFYIKSLQGYQGDTLLRNSAINLFEYYKESLDLDLEPVVDHLNSLINDTLIDYQLVEMQVYNLKQGEEPYLLYFIESQAEFAERFGFKLE